jgi:hypothetical protein
MDKERDRWVVASQVGAALPAIQAEHTAIYVIRNGRDPIAVLVPPEWYEVAVEAMGGPPGSDSPPDWPAPAQLDDGTVATPATPSSVPWSTVAAEPGPPAMP